MASVQTRLRAREASIEMTVIRANGSIERLGTVSYWHESALRRGLWRIVRLLGIKR